jgi:DNA-binding NtrC family response regulator
VSAAHPATPTTWHEAVGAFKRELLERTLVAVGGNRTHAARALGLQRTYLLRLLRDLEVHVPRVAHAAGQERADDREDR